MTGHGAPTESGCLYADINALEGRYGHPGT